jgi:bifunctional DNA-binding transcriptional regulator/antitoxin component of YhaV-PrlF toxin-antitoxin module
MEGFCLQVEQRRRLGLPSEVLDKAGLSPEDRVFAEVRRDGRIILTPMAQILEKYSGAVPGLAIALPQTGEAHTA